MIDKIYYMDTTTDAPSRGHDLKLLCMPDGRWRAAAMPPHGGMT